MKDLKIYKRYEGNTDMYSKVGNPTKESAETFFLIDSLVQDLILIENGNASLAYIEDVNNKLQHSCENVETIDGLKRVARQIREGLL
jgi:hypothetical protein